MQSTPAQPAASNRIIGWFLLGWTALNILSASTLGLHSDEAYYWMFSRYLDWGYFDHPPMVALLIRIGDSLIPHNELGLRLFTVILSTAAMYILWLIAKKYKADPRYFAAIASGVLVFQMYGFITTPDAPLFFFTVLFYYLYQQYLEENKWSTALLLGLVVAGLLYSKYHGLLVVLFTLLSNLRLLKRGSFYGIVVFAAALYLPHILWQVHHHYPSLVYHFFERSSEAYKPEYTYLYVLGQFLMGGPLLGWFLFYYGFTTRIKNAFIRCLMVNAIGTYAFFFISTLKGEVQPHWTLIAFVPLVLLTLIHLRQPGNKPLWIYRPALINTGLIVLFRLLMVAHLPFIMNWGALNSLYRFHTVSLQIKKKVGDAYVIFPSSFQDPSEYNYYTRSLRGFGYDDHTYRRSEYNLWPLEDSLQNKPAILLSDAPLPGLTTDSVLTIHGTKYLNPVKRVRTFQRVEVQLPTYKFTVKAGQQLPLMLQIDNPYRQAIDFGQPSNGVPVTLSADFFTGTELLPEQKAGPAFNRLKIAVGQSGAFRFVITAPDQPGKYDMIFSIRTSPFSGTRNSRIVNFTVR